MYTNRLPGMPVRTDVDHEHMLRLSMYDIICLLQTVASMTQVPELIGIVIRGDEGILARRSFLGKRIRNRFGVGTSLKPRRRFILEVMPVCSSSGRKRETKYYRTVVIGDHRREMLSGAEGFTECFQYAFTLVFMAAMSTEIQPQTPIQDSGDICDHQDRLELKTQTRMLRHFSDSSSFRIQPSPSRVNSSLTATDSIRAEVDLPVKCYAIFSIENSQYLTQPESEEALDDYCPGLGIPTPGREKYLALSKLPKEREPSVFAWYIDDVYLQDTVYFLHLTSSSRHERLRLAFVPSEESPPSNDSCPFFLRNATDCVFLQLRVERNIYNIFHVRTEGKGGMTHQALRGQNIPCRVLRQEGCGG
ncbi:hypothetical protein EV421DRAFT_1740316 [Armillaria borealis]|uniref:Uncharacterized protein n=1 Tax=Armillaria borealis TaxID=47425 RepID=A0AA39J355_9AGAR|nr:hypothetical protein EV421DRAFT_1740316 [Armillaria borealis]